MINKKIKVVDALMGKGKTTALIHHMNSNKDKRFVFVTPYLKEVERIEEECEFIQPKGKNEQGTHRTKLEHFKYLIENGISIATTHQLFKMLDLETIQLLRNWDYVLVLDEVLEVIEISKLSKNEFEALEELHIIKNVDGHWVKGDDEDILQKYSSEWRYAEIVKNLMRNSVEIFDNNILVWLFPVDLLESFSEVYILTFMFEGYPLNPYLKLHNFEIEIYGVEDYKICKYKPTDTSEFKDLLQIYEGKHNQVGEGHSPFTVYWYQTHFKNNPDTIIDVRKGLSNFYKHYMIKTDDVKAQSLIWTCFKDFLDPVSISTINANNFIPHNLRATNEYINKANVLYLVNRNYNPIIKRWLIEKGLTTNDDSFALSEMIQCIWRSRIRRGEVISLYVPSERMRNLLKSWLGL